MQKSKRAKVSLSDTRSARAKRLYIETRARSASWIARIRLWREQITIETEDRSERNSARPSARFAAVTHVARGNMHRTEENRN